LSGNDIDSENLYLNDSFAKKQKIDQLNKLTLHHIENCREYRSILAARNLKSDAQILEDLPYIPARLFKHLDLMSMPDSQIFKVMTSSGTSGNVSKIYLDKFTAQKQTKVLSSTMKLLMNKARLPMIIVDTDEIVNNRQRFNARAAGIFGFSMFGRDHFYCLDKDMNLKYDELQEFINKHSETGIFIFGFTFIIWQNLISQLRKLNIFLDIGPNSILLHGGGWKKLEELNISNELFKLNIKAYTGIEKIKNYYGMIEQTGSIYLECEEGYFHTTKFSDVIIRDPVKNFEPTSEDGVIQVISTLPHSYPGHSILTEDVGKILGENSCACGRGGKYFVVYGRMAGAEMRGCSDTRVLGG
tara:strand:- start:2561 stop:3631 length:1071 start_codon:yes stop_codon:yes gene_type:complete